MGRGPGEGRPTQREHDGSERLRRGGPGTSRDGHAIDPLGRDRGEAIPAEIAIQGDTVEHEHLGTLACAALRSCRAITRPPQATVTLPPPRRTSSIRPAGAVTATSAGLASGALLILRGTGGGWSELWDETATDTSATWTPVTLACGRVYACRVAARGDGATYGAVWGKTATSSAVSTAACDLP